MKSNTEKIGKALAAIRHRPPQQDHFFRKLASSANPLAWLEPLHKEGYFLGARNPAPQELPEEPGAYTVPIWNVLSYLEAVALRNAEKADPEVTERLLEIVHDIATYRADNVRIENPITDWHLVKILSLLPAGTITPEHIGYVKGFLCSNRRSILLDGELGRSLLPKLLNEREVTLVPELLKVMLDYRDPADSRSGDYTSVLDEYHLYEALKDNKPAIAELCALPAAKVAFDKIHSITDRDCHQFNLVWIPAIETHEQTEFPERYDCQMVFFLRDMLERVSGKDVKRWVRDLLDKSHPIFKRVAVHLIGARYRELGDFLWNWSGNPLDDVSLKHELYHLFETNAQHLSQAQTDVVLRWIESSKYLKRLEANNKAGAAYRKKEWLLPLRKTGHANALEGYKRYDQICPVTVQHPGFDVWFGTTGFVDHSPLPKDELCNKSPGDIVEFLLSFRQKRGREGPTEEGLSDTLKTCVSEDTGKFLASLPLFLKVPRVYQSSLLLGFRDAWVANKSLDWGALLRFIEELVTDAGFWEEQNDEQRPWNYRDWIVSEIADLIEEGTRDDSHAFDETLLDAAEKILLLLADKTASTPQEARDDRELYTAAVNSTAGRVFSAMVNYSLRRARVSKADAEKRWPDKVKRDFTKRLEAPPGSSLDLWVVLGRYLHNLLYLSETWVETNINRIFPGDPDRWRAAMIGYLAFSRGVYKDLYALLKDNSHYHKALSEDFGDSFVTEKLIQHICVGYLENLESLDEDHSLISLVFSAGRPEHLAEVIRFFCKTQLRPETALEEKIRPLWRRLYGLLRDKPADGKWRELISELSGWMLLIDAIDEESFDWIKLTATHLRPWHDTQVFLEGLVKHVHGTPKMVGDLYMSMMEAGVLPRYKEEEVKAVVETLFDKGEGQVANRICNAYLQSGHEFLRPLQEHYLGDSA